MKKLAILLFFWFLLGTANHAQNTNLSQLPKAKRDSILTATAKACMLRYAPEWYHESLVPEIKYRGYSKSSKKENRNRQFYSVTYYVDPLSIPESWPFLAKVNVWEDTGKAFSLTYGPGWSKSNLDTSPNTNRDGTPRKPTPYPKQLPRPFGATKTRLVRPEKQVIVLKDSLPEYDPSSKSERIKQIEREWKEYHDKLKKK